MASEPIVDRIGRTALNAAIFSGIVVFAKGFDRIVGRESTIVSWMLTGLACFAVATLCCILAVASSAADDVRRAGGE